MADMFGEGTIPVLEMLISVTESRNRVIANNIANVDTPGYQTQDLPMQEFRAELDRAVKQRREENMPSLPFSSTERIKIDSNGHLRPKTVELEPSRTGPLRHDGNNVNIDHEMVKLSGNAMLHNMMIQLLNREYAMLNTAISERIS